VPLLSSRRPAIVAGLVSLSIAGVAAVPASANDYPSQVNKNFMSSCVKAAVKAGGGKITKGKATSYCQSALDCISGKLTLKQFQEADEAAAAGKKSKYDKTINACVKKASSKLT
jgi:hypothetical protein